jgi:hypothetical protein
MTTVRKKASLVAGGLAVVAVLIGAGRGPAATLTVCPNGCAFSEIAPALAVAKNGDTISIAPGTYAGGFTIDTSVNLAGAGPSRTIIIGGGPVITVGVAFSADEPTVSINGVTITGGVTRSSWATGPGDGVIALGGGVEIPPNADFSGGATVTISNSVITDNRVAPTNTAPFGCRSGRCAFALGGGIDTWGTLSLANTTVSNNLIGSAAGLSTPTSNAEGAGIHNQLGALTITNSALTGNKAAATAPNGLIADAGGIVLGGLFGFGAGSLSMANSSVANNSATVNGDFSFGFVASAGIHVNGNANTATITNTTISSNAATVTNSLGNATVVSGGLKTDIDATLINDSITDNTITAMTLLGSSGNAVGRSGAGEMGGTLNNVRLTGNSIHVSSATGNATALGGASVFDDGTITNSLIGNNRVDASAPLGAVDVRGGGVTIFGSTALRNSTVSGNTVNADGASGSANGGGIYDGFNPDGPSGGALVLQHSSITDNGLSGSAGIPLHGGGIFLQGQPITTSNSLISGNNPDQCFGC